MIYMYIYFTKYYSSLFLFFYPYSCFSYEYVEEKTKFLDNAIHITFSCCFRKRIEAVYANFETEILNFYDDPYFR